MYVLGDQPHKKNSINTVYAIIRFENIRYDQGKHRKLIVLKQEKSFREEHFVDFTFPTENTVPVHSNGKGKWDR